MEQSLDYEDFDCRKIKIHRNKLDLSQLQLAEWMGVNRTAVIRYEKGGSIPPASKKKLRRFLEIDSIQELKGSLIDEYGVEYKSIFTEEYFINVPYIPVASYKTFTKTFDYGTLKLNFKLEEINTGFYVAFEVKGEAMDDGSRQGLCMGDIVLAKEIEKEVIPDNAISTDLWVIILENDILFRKVENYNSNENKISFKANNPSLEYADFSLDISDIKKVFQIKQITIKTPKLSAI